MQSWEEEIYNHIGIYSVNGLFPEQKVVKNILHLFSDRSCQFKEALLNTCPKPCFPWDIECCPNLISCWNQVYQILS